MFPFPPRGDTAAARPVEPLFSICTVSGELPFNLLVEALGMRREGSQIRLNTRPVGEKVRITADTLEPKLDGRLQPLTQETEKTHLTVRWTPQAVT